MRGAAVSEKACTPEDAHRDGLAREEAETAAEVGHTSLVTLHSELKAHAALLVEAALLDRCPSELVLAAVELAALAGRMVETVEKHIVYYVAKEVERDGATTH